MIREFTLEEGGLRADVAVSAALELSRAAAASLLEKGLVTTAAGKPVRKNEKLPPGTHLLAELPDPEPLEAQPQEIPLDVRYEDEDVIVVNKPRGLVVHPAPGHPDGTLVNALLHHCGESLSGIGGVQRPGIVHRIDRDTSGLLIVAKNDLAHQKLSADLKKHEVSRVYEAVVLGNLREDAFTIDRPLGRHPQDRKKMAVVRNGGREAVTHVTVLARYPGYTHVRCELETGRTHQIRVHLASIGHPVAGDPVYGPKKDPFRLEGQCLHARTLRFRHPRTGQEMVVTTELPAYFVGVLKKLEQLNS